eukprot:13821473-Ditylum_brightwellii.AAC.1
MEVDDGAEKDREEWPTIQFRTANQRSEGRKDLTNKDKKIFKEACKKWEGVYGSIWNKLTGKEKSKLIKAKREKKAQNNGGLGS